MKKWQGDKYGFSRKGKEKKKKKLAKEWPEKQHKSQKHMKTRGKAECCQENE